MELMTPKFNAMYWQSVNLHTYKSAFELAQSMETADQNTNDLQAAP